MFKPYLELFFVVVAVPVTISTLVIQVFGNVAMPNLIQLKKVAVNFGLVIAMTNGGITKT